MLSFGLHLNRPTVLARKRHSVLVAQGLELQLKQCFESRRYLPRRKILRVHSFDALSNLEIKRPSQHHRIVLGPLQLLRHALAAPGGKVGIVLGCAVPPIVPGGPSLPISYRCFTAILPLLGHSRHDTPINGRQVAVEEKRGVGFGRLARLPLPGLAVTHANAAPSYFIECLLYNVPDDRFGPELAPTYLGILTWLKTARLNDFQCQNGQLPLFGPQPEQWSVKKARAFVKALQEMWDTWR